MKVYSFKPEYQASWSKKPAGSLGGSLDIEVSSPELWTMVPVASSEAGDTVRSGHHYLPLFKGGPLPSTLNTIKTEGCTVETLKVKNCPTVKVQTTYN